MRAPGSTRVLYSLESWYFLHARVGRQGNYAHSGDFQELFPLDSLHRVASYSSSNAFPFLYGPIKRSLPLSSTIAFATLH